MKNWLLTVMVALLAGCSTNSYYGYIYDFETGKPISGVEVDDILNQEKTVSDANGYFFLKHENKIVGKLILKKAGYDIDTLETLSMRNGERFEERFKGDTIYLFDVKTNFRDSIIKLNYAK